MELTEQKRVAIRSIADSAGGLALKEMLDWSIETAKDALVRTDPNKLSEICYHQATAEICQGFQAFLEKDLETLLTEYGIEPEGDEHEDEK